MLTVGSSTAAIMPAGPSHRVPDRLRSAWPSLTGVFALFGGGLQSYANQSAGPLVFALLVLLFAIPAFALVSPPRRAETRGFALTFGTCVLAGGLAQCYAFAMVDSPQDFGDAVEFFRVAADSTFVAFDSEHSWAVLAWQGVNWGARALGVEVTPGLGVTLNAVVMGLVGALSVSIARTLLGDDRWRLRRVGTLVASCGLFLLFGALMLRDSFVVLFDTVWVWSVVRWLVKPGFRRLSLAVLVTVVAMRAMMSLRPEAVLVYGLYGFVAVLSWYAGGRLNIARLGALLLVLFSLVLAGDWVRPYMDSLLEGQTGGSEKYTEVSQGEASRESLGMRFVVSQPLPIRMLTGTGLLLVGVIPLWANFTLGLSSYHWLKGYHAVFQVVVIPLVLVGTSVVLRLLFNRGRQMMPWVFLSIWGLLGLMAVVASSLEQRHLTQFVTVLVIFAALPDTRDALVRSTCRKVAAAWLMAVFGLHLAWAIAKGAV